MSKLISNLRQQPRLNCKLTLNELIGRIQFELKSKPFPNFSCYCCHCKNSWWLSVNQHSKADLLWNTSTFFWLCNFHSDVFTVFPLQNLFPFFLKVCFQSDVLTLRPNELKTTSEWGDNLYVCICVFYIKTTV